MTIWGKVLGSAAGFALGGPLGALIGLAAGHGVDYYHANRIAASPDTAPKDDATRHVAFTIAVIALGAKMAKADGRVTRDEVAAFRDVFHVPPDELANVARVFDLARRSTAGYEVYAAQIGRMFKNDRSVLEELVDALFHIAKQDGGVRPSELAYLADVARLFGLSEATFERLRASQMDEDELDPYAVLGVPRDIDDKALQRVWRKLAREHHPDALVAHGMPPEFVALAEERLAGINAAYDRIRAERGLKPDAA